MIFRFRCSRLWNVGVSRAARPHVQMPAVFGVVDIALHHQQAFGLPEVFFRQQQVHVAHEPRPVVGVETVGEGGRALQQEHRDATGVEDLQDHGQFVPQHLVARAIGGVQLGQVGGQVGRQVHQKAVLLQARVPQGGGMLAVGFGQQGLPADLRAGQLAGQVVFLDVRQRRCQAATDQNVGGIGEGQHIKRVVK